MTSQNLQKTNAKKQSSQFQEARTLCPADGVIELVIQIQAHSLYVYIRRFYSVYNKFTEQISTTYHSHLALQLIRPWLPLDLCCAGPRFITYIKAGALVSKRGPSCVKTVFSKKAVICKKTHVSKLKYQLLYGPVCIFQYRYPVW